MMPVCDRWRAIRPNCLFLKPAIALPSPINRVVRTVPATVWTVHTATCWSRLRSTAQIRVAALVRCAAMVGGLVNVFSREVCSHHCAPRRTRTGLCIWEPSGSSRPKVRTFTQDQQVPVHTLSTMDEPVRSFHIPAYKGTDLFQERGGTGGRSLNACCFFALRGILAACFSRRAPPTVSAEQKERGEP